MANVAPDAEDDINIDLGVDLDAGHSAYGCGDSGDSNDGIGTRVSGVATSLGLSVSGTRPSIDSVLVNDAQQTPVDRYSQPESSQDRTW